MRRPMECWERTAEALEKMIEALRRVAASTPVGNDRAEMRAAEAAVKALREHVDSSEECEKP